VQIPIQSFSPAGFETLVIDTQMKTKLSRTGFKNTILLCVKEMEIVSIESKLIDCDVF
jgi:hypothetical protein